jgi:uncharacterized cupin superfamily protein
VSQTTFHVAADAMPSGPLERCHDGVGALQCIRVLQGGAKAGRHLNFLHDDILPPGTSIGLHRHKDDEEYYYIVSGRGTMTLDGRRIPVRAGDITAVLPGGEHGLENDSDADMRIIVISAI